MGTTDLVQHSINTGNAPPIKQPPRRIPVPKMAEANREIDDMLEKELSRHQNVPGVLP